MPEPGEKGERDPSLPEKVRGLAGDHKLYLVVTDLRTNVQPGVTYGLYLELPPNAAPEIAQMHLVGSLNFFAATVDDDPSNAGKRPDRFITFDVTSPVKALSAAGKLDESVTVTIVPDAAPASAANPLIGEIQLIEQ